jgi:Protein of unknown function (DUF3048) N-terminal domain/Protein of unknown function (DUF3048) C-terminal domain
VSRAAAAVALTLTLALVAGACGGGGDGKDARPRSSSTTTTTAPPVAPLTGLADPSGIAQTRPVLSVKVENTPDARPQSGLEAADIVWDEVVEGQITRLLAMYQSRSTDVVGPIRSVRLTDPLIVWPVGGIFAFSGGAPAIVTAIEAAPVKVIDENAADAAMFRDRSKRAPHNLFGRPDALWAFGGTPAPPPPLFRYLESGKPVTAGTPATSVSIGFRGVYSVAYTWDVASGTWLRSTAGRPFMARSGVQIATQNVVVLPVTYDGGVGKEGSVAELIGQGTATVLSGGRAIPAHWTRPDRTRPMELTTPEGTPIRLVPGSTWVELPDVSYPVDVVAPPPAPAP